MAERIEYRNVSGARLAPSRLGNTCTRHVRIRELAPAFAWRLPGSVLVESASASVTVLTLFEDDELARLDVPEFATEPGGTGFVWYHMAIPDRSTPGKTFDEAWTRDGTRIFGSPRAGGRILVHYAGGLGRSSMVAAKLLAALGAPAIHAVAAVRWARPGAIETDDQLDYVLNGPSLAADGSSAPSVG